MAFTRLNVTRAAEPSVPGHHRAFGIAAVQTSLVVGTVLTFVNHSEILRLEFGRDLPVAILLNYMVPFLVAGYSRHRLLRRLRTEEGES